MFKAPGCIFVNCLLVLTLAVVALSRPFPTSDGSLTSFSSIFNPIVSLSSLGTFECPPGTPVNATQLGLKCVHGNLTCFNNSNGRHFVGCNCTPGWAGVECDRCNTSAVCGSQPCDNHAIPVKKKFYQCDLTSDFWKTALGDGVASFEQDLEHKRGVLNVWSQPTGPPMFFSCNVTDCTFSVDQGRDGTRFDYYCMKTSCWCPRDPKTGHCYSQQIENATQFLKTTMLFSCDDGPNPSCYVQQHELGLEIDMQCYPGECARPPDWVQNIVWPVLELIFVLLLFIVIAIFPALIYSIYKRAGVRSDGYSKIKFEAAETKGANLYFDRLKYTMLVPSNKFGLFPPLHKKRILRKVYGDIKPGELCCILGASGAGKTSLLDILAGFDKEGEIDGRILVDGQPFPKNYKKLIGFVPQHDALLSTLTVREQLRYHAELRLPSDLYSLEAKHRLVEETMAELGITHIADTQIGDDETRGISGGEKRRVSIATELVTLPRLLFLDEPTSGLDSYNALSIMRKLKQLAEADQRTIVCSIHQPRAMIFGLFDRVILLWKGRVVFSGPRKDIAPFFNASGYHCPDDLLSADWLIDTLAMEEDEKVLELVKKARSEFKAKTAHRVEPLDESILDKGSINHENGESGPAVRDLHALSEALPSVPWYFELAILTHRSFLNLWRNPVLLKTHALADIFVALFLGIAYFGVSNNVGGLQNRIGSLFFLSTIFSFSSLTALNLFIGERPIFLRERASGAYSTTTYFISKILTDLIPLRIILPALFASVVYWMVGYASSLDHFVRYLIVVLEVNFVSAALLICVSCLTNSLAAATFSSSLLLLLMLLFGGFLLNFGTIPVYFVWIRYLSYFSFANEALLGNELHQLPVNIDVSDIQGVTVHLIMFLLVAGDLFLDAFKLNPNDYWINVGVLVGQGLLYLVIALFLLMHYVKWRQ